MANTTSWAWPNIFNVSQNRVSIYEDNQSIVSRSRLLILTEPTEVYNEPNQGVGLKRYMFQYNNDNIKAEIRDRSADQFALHDPSINAPNTQWANGLLFTGAEEDSIQKANTSEITLSIETVYGDKLSVDLNSIN